MSKKSDAEWQLLSHTYFLYDLLARLHNQDLLIKSQLFDDAYSDSEGDQIAKQAIEQIKIANRGFMTLFLYGLLVKPRELIGRDSQKVEWGRIDDWIRKKADKIECSYSHKNSQCECLRHMRNAIAHAKLDFDNSGHAMIFEDNNPQTGEKFHVQLSVHMVAELLAKLAHLVRIRLNSLRTLDS